MYMMEIFFSAGRGALARHGDFWYPVRLIQRVDEDWWVQWWRETYFTSTSVVAGGVSLVESTDIVDSLWLNCASRRTIRVGTSADVKILN